MGKSLITTEELHKELDLVQGCIMRMAQNSFVIKGWAFTLVVALIALTAEKISLPILCATGIFILLTFWGLDAFFLKTEKLYRFKYEWIIEQRPLGNKNYLYDLNPTNKKMCKKNRKTPTTFQVMFSKPYTLLLFYGNPILVCLVLLVLRLCSLM